MDDGPAVVTIAISTGSAVTTWMLALGNGLLDHGGDGRVAGPPLTLVLQRTRHPE